MENGNKKLKDICAFTENYPRNLNNFIQIKNNKYGHCVDVFLKKDNKIDEGGYFIICKKFISTDFLYHFLKNYALGLKKENIKDLEIIIVPADVQKKIINVIESLKELIFYEENLLKLEEKRLLGYLQKFYKN